MILGQVRGGGEVCHVEGEATSMMSLPWMPHESISESSMRYDVSGPHLRRAVECRAVE